MESPIIADDESGERCSDGRQLEIRAEAREFQRCEGMGRTTSGRRFEKSQPTIEKARWRYPPGRVSLTKCRQPPAGGFAFATTVFAAVPTRQSE